MYSKLYGIQENLQAITPASGAIQGVPLVVSGSIRIPVASYAAGEIGVFNVMGAFRIKKAAGVTFVDGDPVYWNSATAACTTDSTKPTIGTALGIAASAAVEMDVAVYPVETPPGQKIVRVQTTASTVTEVYRTALVPDGSLVELNVESKGSQSGVANSCADKFTALFQRVGSLAFVEASNYSHLTTEAAQAWGGITFDVSGNYALVKVTGLAATTIDWEIKINVLPTTLA